MASTYEIWGQNDEENIAHADSYSVNEALSVEADSAKEAVQTTIMRYVQESLEKGTPLTELIPAPANGDHWHFKTVDAFDHTKTAEFAVRFKLIPALEVGELEPRTPGEDASI